jgi:hypothetical protein
VQAQQRQARNADRHRRLVKLAVGDKVLLSTEGLQLRGQNNKLCSPYVGPFDVTEVVNANAFRLALPPQMQALHPVFNISRLKPYVSNSAAFASRPQRFDRPPPEVSADSNGDALWVVDRVLACKKVGRGKRYLVAWKGYPPEENTWEPHASISHTTAFEEFQAAQRVDDAQAELLGSAIANLQSENAGRLLHRRSTAGVRQGSTSPASPRLQPTSLQQPPAYRGGPQVATSADHAVSNRLEAEAPDFSGFRSLDRTIARRAGIGLDRVSEESRAPPPTHSHSESVQHDRSDGWKDGGTTARQAQTTQQSASAAGRNTQESRRRAQR